MIQENGPCGDEVLGIGDSGMEGMIISSLLH